MYKTGFDRDQLALFPTSLQDMIDKNSIVWVIDAFVDSLDLVDFNFKYSTPNKLGNRPYNPKDLLKLYFLAIIRKFVLLEILCILLELILNVFGLSKV